LSFLSFPSNDPPLSFSLPPRLRSDIRFDSCAAELNESPCFSGGCCVGVWPGGGASGGGPTGGTQCRRSRILSEC
jgi:hypothetical protein